MSKQIPAKNNDLHTEYLKLQMGPSHPAMHGTVRIKLSLDGETVVGADVEVGYLHRGMEKSCENQTWTQVIPYTDRLNYVSPLINNVGYAMAVEKLLDIDIPERNKYIRVLMSEIARIADHLTSVGAMAMEIAAFTPFLWTMQAREEFYFLIEEVTGARVTSAYTRIGGLRGDLTDDFAKHYQTAEGKLLKLMDDIEALLTKNKIFYDRLIDVGTISKEHAVDLGFTGPVLRSTGVDYDVRKDHPYLIYDRLDFDVPVGVRGDNYDRYLVRMEEIRQSVRIIRQVLHDMPDGPIDIDDWNIVLPPKDAVYNSIEATIAHFMQIIHGIQVPAGEAYAFVEGGNGEVGFYVVSDGSGKPWRMHVRGPCFSLVQGLEDMVRGQMVADIIPTFDSLNMIGGEIDR